MSISQLLASMCADLTEADLNAIRKARGFGAHETASKDAFANYFVSSVGLEKVMRQLSAEECITLHLLHKVGEANISFFERLYGSSGLPGRPFYGTYTQHFKPTFDSVKKNLVRKGLLIVAEIKTRGDSVQMERWRFAFPPEFAPFLPPLYQTRIIDQTGETSDRAIRKKLLQLIGGEPVIADDSVPIYIKNGNLFLGDQPFTVKEMCAWQFDSWENMLGMLTSDVNKSLHPIDAICSLLSGMDQGEWVSTKVIEPILKIFCYGAKLPPVKELLLQGWELGLLSRLETEGDIYFRFAPQLTQSDSENLPPSIPWLHTFPNQSAVKVDLLLIPLFQLELLNALAYLTVKENAVFSSPNLIQMGHSLPAQRQSPLAQWLAENISDFQKTLTTANQRWGKTLLHENLLVARVCDLSLRIQLERELGPQIVVLSEQFIAFPKESRSSVEKVLKKSGFVIKTVGP